MDFLEILQNRASDKNYNGRISAWLLSNINGIIDKASDHLRYVQNVLNEFDIHDDNHSASVLHIIENLLGDRAKELSSYDLFSLIAVSYLHDCGMAVSDYEIRVMNLVENEEFDGKRVCTKEQARSIINNNQNRIFKTENDLKDIKDWLFYPGGDNAQELLFDYYSQLLIDYQLFRNGKIDAIKKSVEKDKSNEKKVDGKETFLEKTNKELSISFIRDTHADRVEAYIKTWGDTLFKDFLGNKAMGKRLADNLAIACKAHGQDADFVCDLKKYNKVMYIGRETSNLQFVAMMLRIGDIVHFSYERAPYILRALHHFESDISHDHWQIKADSGVNYSISEDGEISFSAYCSIPKDYYNLMSYVDGIDQELSLYNRLKRESTWASCYPVLAKNKVNRDNIAYDDSFTPVPNLKFTLEQNRILDLLMGAKLYSNEYACIRELYQNSMDACRCQIAIDQSKGKKSKGKIEFGLGTDKDGNKYVYCLDNGKGMSKHIIEHYLLKVGSSYYQSSDFYQSQADTGNTFTPTSQFGIGILSCFMIGDKIEITTREEGSPYISCAMESIHECFYYKTPSDLDTDLIASSGTLIKVFLNSNYKERLSNIDYKDIGYLLWQKYNEFDKHSFSDHLYFIIDGFVQVVAKDIVLDVKMNDGYNLRVLDKPLPMGEGIFHFPKDNSFSNRAIKEKRIFILDVEHEGIQCKKSLVLPISYNSSLSFNLDFDYNFVYGERSSYCVDGIRIEDDDFVSGDYLSLTNELGLDCTINFGGSDRPQLNISRDSIVNYVPSKYEDKIKVLLCKLVEQAIDIIATLISEYKIKEDSSLYRSIWESFFKAFNCMPASMVAQYLNKGPIRDLSMPLPKAFTSSNLTFGEFYDTSVCFKNYHLFLSDSYMDNPVLLHSLILSRMHSTRSIVHNGKNVTIKGYEPDYLINTISTHYVARQGGLYSDYDIVLSQYPFVSSQFYKIVQNSKYRKLYDKLESFIEKGIKSYLNDEEKDKFSHGTQSEAISEFFTNNKIFLKQEARLIAIPNNYAITVFASFPRLWSVRAKDIVGTFPEEIPYNGGVSFIFFSSGRGVFDYCVVPGRKSRHKLAEYLPKSYRDSLKKKKKKYKRAPLVSDGDGIK